MRRNTISDAMETAPTELTIIAKGTRLEGKSLKTAGDLRVDGELDVEQLDVGHRIIVGPEGSVRVGRLRTQEGVISGLVSGHMAVSATIVIKDTGRISGQLDAARLVVEDGGMCDGTFNVGTGASSQSVQRRYESAAPPREPED